MNKKQNEVEVEVREHYVINCIDTDSLQYKADERKGCNRLFPISVKLKKGQAKCPFDKKHPKCGKRTRYDVNDGVSMSRAIHGGPYASREAAQNEADRKNQHKQDWMERTTVEGRKRKELREERERRERHFKETGEWFQ